MENKLNLKMMSPKELLNQKLIEPSAVAAVGIKKCFPDETSDEIVSQLQDDLLKMLCYERVEKSNARSQAEYNAMTGLVVVTRKLGKWSTFGYRTNNLECLRYYEALYLIDTNRLELYYDSVLVSLEQAYALLLNNQHNYISHEKYFIYSSLSKAGYNVQPHRRHIRMSDGSSSQNSSFSDITPADKCVWRWLFQSLKQPILNEDIGEVNDDQLYLKVEDNMKNIQESIKSQHSHSLVDPSSNDEDNSWQNAVTSVKGRKKSTKKRKFQPTTSKKVTLGRSTNDFLDVLTHEKDVCNFQKIFDEIQVIQLDRTHCDNDGNEETTIESSDVEFDFDLYLTRPNFKQSDPGVPNFRILIFKLSEKPPTRDSIVKALLKPTVRTPVLVFYVNEVMRSMDPSFNDVRVLCWVLTCPQNHRTKAIHIKRTWGKRCDKLLFISTEEGMEWTNRRWNFESAVYEICLNEDSTIDAIAVPGMESGRDALWGKTKAALKYAWEHHKNEFDWFMKADDDTYVIVENLKKFLSNYSKTDPIFFGCQFSAKEIPSWTSGGAGYVLSVEALRRFVVDGLPNPEYCNVDNAGCEDAELAKCLFRVGVTLEDSRDSFGRHRFLAFTPADHLFPRTLTEDDKNYWYWRDLTYPQVQGMDCCASDAISYHYITNRDMYVLEYFLYHIRPVGVDREQKYVQEYPLEFEELTSTSAEPTTTQPM